MRLGQHVLVLHYLTAVIICVLPIVHCLPHQSQHDIKVKMRPEQYKRQLELIKMDILEKLGMSSPPKAGRDRVSHEPVPKAILDNFQRAEREQETEGDDKKNEIIIIGKKSRNTACQSPKCVRFLHRPKVEGISKVRVRTLWLHIKPGKHKEAEQVLEVYSVNQKTGVIMTNILNSKLETGGRGGWQAVTISRQLPWFEPGTADTNSNSTVTKAHDTIDILVRFKCRNCKVTNELGEQPFLVTERRSLPAAKKSRLRRSPAECTEMCCLDNFEVNFKEVGWDNWIVVPLKYDARYCRGMCNLDNATGMREHSTLIMNLAQRTKRKVNQCCIATHFKGMMMLLRDEDGNVVNKFLPNLIATKCSCT